MDSLTPHIFFHSDIDSADDWRAALATEFREFEFSTTDDVHSAQNANVALIWTVPKGGIRHFSRLRAILSLAAGVNQIDLTGLPKDVPLARLVDTSLTRTMVDYAKAAVYRHHRRFHIFEKHSREHRWKFIAPRLTGDTSVGILGLGEIGRSIALALQSEGFDVHGWSRAQKRLEGVETYSGHDGLIKMIGSSNIVLNVLPLTESTRHILSRSLFEDFAAGTCLINIGRGEHLVEADLLDAIVKGKIEAATLDVTSVEPLPSAHPFWNHPSILLTPHVAGSCLPMSAVKPIAANIRKAIMGEPLSQQVDFKRGY